jgi:hypothetical protein
MAPSGYFPECVHRSAAAPDSYVRLGEGVVLRSMIGHAHSAQMLEPQALQHTVDQRTTVFDTVILLGNFVPIVFLGQ